MGQDNRQYRVLRYSGFRRQWEAFNFGTYGDIGQFSAPRDKAQAYLEAARKGWPNDKFRIEPI